jgi:UDP-N-acetylmuramoyl-tripeptide--D-alanyl-D-alanine ligase
VKALSLEEIRRHVHGLWRTAGSDSTVEGVTIDSRTAGEGDLFIAIRGDRFDGHDFLPKAAAAGCTAAVVSREVDLPDDVDALFPAGVIGVSDTTVALGELASYYRDQVSATAIAVTGSNGKTTVKQMIQHILSGRLTGSCSPKSFNNNIGVPLTLLAVEAGDDYVVCEVGSNAPGEIAALAAMVRPQVAVITSVAATHLEKLVSVDHVAVEKASILGSLAADGLAVVWADSSELARAMTPYDRRTIRFGASDDAELRLTGFETDGRRQRFQVNGRLWVDLPLPGRHNAMNALAALAVAQRLGLAEADAAAALADFPGTPQRLDRVEGTCLTLINDAYNSNPASLLAAVDVLVQTPGKRRVLIAGDMAELGEDTDKIHADTGGRIASEAVDLLIGVGKLGRYIAQGAAAGGAAIEEFASVTAATRGVEKLLRRGDVVLLKGSRVMRMERLVEPLCKAFPPAGRKKKPPSKGPKR